MDEPIERFAAWLADAEAREPNNPGAMSVATADADGRPSLRMVLLRGFDARGFVFYTNLDSRKGRELRERPYAALCFHWKSLDRQVRIEGPVEAVGTEEADAYFASRPKDSQIGAWASKQSQALTTRFELESRVAKYGLLYGIGKVPRPPFWSGYRVLPDAIEFWEERPFRLHDRTLYRRSADGWTTTKLFP
ncbi:MAG: pyridoxamine 5'-phosphate oxidase [Gammaproteobacteria bacterium]